MPGNRILAVDMFPVDKPDWVDSLWPAERLDELLPLVDFLVLSVPLNATDAGDDRRRGDGEDEAGGRAGQRGPRTAGRRKLIWSRRWKAGIWRAR